MHAKVSSFIRSVKWTWSWSDAVKAARRHNTNAADSRVRNRYGYAGLQTRSLMVTTLLLLLLAMSGMEHANAFLYSAKLNNCYEMHSGFTVESINGTAPTQLLTINATTTNQTVRRFFPWLRQETTTAAAMNLTMSTTTPSSATTTTTTTSAMPPTTTAAPLERWTSEGAHAGVMPAASGWKCCCWSATAQDEIECRCEGDALIRVPQNLTVPMQRLTIATAGLPRVRSTGLRVYARSLYDVVLTDLLQLECIEDDAFSSLRLLRTIYISAAPKLTHLSRNVFRGISDTIQIIRIINSGLITVPDLAFLPTKNILQMIDLDNNHITRIETHSINIKTDQLILANNEINYIDDSAFHGSQIYKLSLKDNLDLKEVHKNAFSGMMITELDLSSTALVRLPSAGLEDIEELRIQGTHTLKTIPSIYEFKNLQRAYLTHPFHCCAFKYPSRHDPKRHAELMQQLHERQLQCKNNNNADPSASQEADDLTRQLTGRGRRIKIVDANGEAHWISREAVDSTASADQNDRLYSRLLRAKFVAEMSDAQLADLGRSVDQSDDNTGEVEEIDEYDTSPNSDRGIFHTEIVINTEENDSVEYCGNFTVRKYDVECYPTPDALNPCEDVMGYQWLRISVWIVVLLAVVGNIAVLVVILSIRSESASVPRFLMSHLAFADLCLGLYLLLIASIDAHSMGEYFNYAYDWQYGAGCKVAGFLTVFASHLSVFTLTVITIERWIAITQAMYMNKRIKLRSAAYIMVGGWIYAICMSVLPLFGISNYSSTSICLPMQIGDLYDTIYLVSVLVLNGTAFFIIAICYSHIYFSLGTETRHTHARLGEMSVAKKMALLVFTNFACCAPIAFFGLTALAGYPLINVTKSKILLVFFYPLNSCADPYLYAILTSQYREDLYTLLAKLGLCKQTAVRYKDSFSLPASANIAIHRPSLMSTHHNGGGKLLNGGGGAGAGAVGQAVRLPETQFMLPQLHTLNDKGIMA